jgi:hypothetical protein
VSVPRRYEFGVVHSAKAICESKRESLAPFDQETPSASGGKFVADPTCAGASGAALEAMSTCDTTSFPGAWNAAFDTR